MSFVRGALWAESIKARHSRVLLVTGLVFLLVPFLGAVIVVVLRDPEAARRLGLISMKAQIVAAAADWATYLGILTQAIAVGGLVVFAVPMSWIFGREFADHTVKDWLALPVSRTQIVAAKLTVVLLWALVVLVGIAALGLVIGVMLSLPVATPLQFLGWLRTYIVTGLLTLALMGPVALVASLGRGYLAPMGFAFATIVMGQIAGFLGWGAYFPWSAPALLSGAAGDRAATLEPISFVIVLLTSAASIVVLILWWERADQSR